MLMNILSFTQIHLYQPKSINNFDDIISSTQIQQETYIDQMLHHSKPYLPPFLLRSTSSQNGFLAGRIHPVGYVEIQFHTDFWIDGKGLN